MDEVILFIDSAQLDDTARQNLDHVSTKPYDAIFEYLNSLSRTLELGKESVRSSPPHLSYNHITIVSSLENPAGRQSKLGSS